MFKVIGGAVVLGMALYGLVRYLDRPMMKVYINAKHLEEQGSVASKSAGGEAATTTGDLVEPM